MLKGLGPEDCPIELRVCMVLVQYKLLERSHIGLLLSAQMRVKLAARQLALADLRQCLKNDATNALDNSIALCKLYVPQTKAVIRRSEL